jgi:hypothetical protein
VIALAAMAGAAAVMIATWAASRIILRKNGFEPPDDAPPL